ncbi:MAG: hypothetical protein ACD_24C00485G0005 [uncultured bacterium]|uniref:Uncharacterized protein n=1 Tax=candidate division WWE3 bacterium RBG_16_37_10 TaxID=1802610 RepID=A0A1F4V1C8_UNCKA|nr:MAG: hypothetical protein ACD_24C00485G0005 [uncultured bacterium]OGC50979.1 MAG: hypothetical protein A2W32_04130 [candidate division WWE3 bacterium RBG_16_37_10]HBH18561.1 hypothetical protein [Cyanobacteria bacterium UBA9579]
MGNKLWSNFHGVGIHDRKLKYVCNDNELRGSYIKDIFKGIIRVQSTRFKKSLTDKNWVTGLWNKLNIQGDFDLTVNKHRQ